MQEAYKKGFLLAPPVVLGRQLRPFSLGHAFLLDMFDSPFIRGGVVSGEEFIFGAWICCHSFEDAVVAIQNADMAKDCHRWGRKCRRIDMAGELRRFLDYVEEACEAPKRWERTASSDNGTGTATASAVPWPLALFWSLSEGGINEGLWDMPLGRVMAYSAARAASLGDTSLVSEETLTALDALGGMEHGESTG